MSLTNHFNPLNMTHDLHLFSVIQDPDGYFEQADFMAGTDLQIQLRIKNGMISEIHFNLIGSTSNKIVSSLENVARLVEKRSIQEILQSDFDLKLNKEFTGDEEILIKGFSGIRQAIHDYQKRALSSSGIDVVGGLIWKGDNLLIAQRKIDDVMGGLWEFPGGKREPHETLAMALVREIKEELDISIRVKNLFSKLNGTDTPKKITLFIFNCEYLGGTPQALECTDWQWITRSQLTLFKFMPLDQLLINSLAG